MPELPEVETVRRGLQKQIVGKTISKIIIKKPNLVKQSGRSFRKELIGKQFGKIDRIGKLLIFTILPSVKSSQTVADDVRTDADMRINVNDTRANSKKSKSSNTQSPKFLIIHLKMTGQLVYCDDKNFIAGGHANSKKEEEQFLRLIKERSFLEEERRGRMTRRDGRSGTSLLQSIKRCQPGKYTHIIFEFTDESKLFFNDLRQFGMLKVVNGEELKEIKSKYGIEPGRSNFTFKNFQKALKNRKTNIKALLLNQSVISGLGNIYVDESLFAGKIHPQRPANSLTINEQKRLFNAIQRIIKLAIKNNGTTFSDFIDSKGKKGNFKEKLKVYSRQGQSCPRCKNDKARPCPSKKDIKIQKIKVAGRGTHFCPRCQK